MNYELALKLKEAGMSQWQTAISSRKFARGKSDQRGFIWKSGAKQDINKHNFYNLIKVPTVKELAKFYNDNT